MPLNELDPVRLDEVSDLACGRYGIVRHMINPRNDRHYAVKFYNPHRFSGDSAALMNQVSSLIGLSHPCVNPILLFTPPRDGSGPVIASTFLPMGSLDEVLQKIERHNRPDYWTNTQIAIVAAGIALGMNYLHACGITHGTLKPADILLDGNCRARITDYATYTLERLRAVKSSQVGSPSYLAPEVYEDGVVPTQKIDVFAFGLILYELVVGGKVFPTALSTAAVMKRVLLGHRPKIPASVEPWVRTMIERCWGIRPDARPTFAEIVDQMNSHEFRLFSDVDTNIVSAFTNDMQNG